MTPSRVSSRRPARSVDVPPPSTGMGPCESCGSGRVTSISMTLTDGTPVDFTSCHACEHRTWRHAGGALALDGVLSRATKPRQAG